MVKLFTLMRNCGFHQEAQPTRQQVKWHDLSWLVVASGVCMASQSVPNPFFALRLPMQSGLSQARCTPFSFPGASGVISTERQPPTHAAATRRRWFPARPSVRERQRERGRTNERAAHALSSSNKCVSQFGAASCPTRILWEREKERGGRERTLPRPHRTATSPL